MGQLVVGLVLFSLAYCLQGLHPEIGIRRTARNVTENLGNEFLLAASTCTASWSKQWCVENYGGWDADQNASFAPLDKIARDAGRALSGNADDQREEIDTLTLMLDGLGHLGRQLMLGVSPSFGQFWRSMPQLDNANVAVETFVKKWATLAKGRLTRSEETKISGYVDLDRDGFVSPEECLSWIHAVNFLWLFVRSPSDSQVAIDQWCPGGHYGYRCRPGSREGAAHCCLTGATPMPDWMPNPRYTKR